MSTELREAAAIEQKVTAIALDKFSCDGYPQARDDAFALASSLWARDASCDARLGQDTSGDWHCLGYRQRLWIRALAMRESMASFIH